MNRILFLGMDLSGKTNTSVNTGNALDKNIRSNLLTSNRKVYNEIVSKMKVEKLTDKEKLY